MIRVSTVLNSDDIAGIISCRKEAVASFINTRQREPAMPNFVKSAEAFSAGRVPPFAQTAAACRAFPLAIALLSLLLRQEDGSAVS